MSPSHRSALVFLGFTGLLASCSSASPDSRDVSHGHASGTQTHASGTGGASAFDNVGPTNAGGSGASSDEPAAHTPAPDAGCGSSEFSITELPPNVMILLDRSGSMDGDAGDDTRWNVAKKAIETLTSTFDDRIR